MTTATTVIPTERASRYLQQLCKHFAHKIEVEFDAAKGRIVFGLGTVDLAATGDALTITCTVSDADALPQLEQIVEKHLDRFAFREGELVYEWKSA